MNKLSYPRSLPPLAMPAKRTTMPLVQDVTFESLGAVKEEIREWLGPNAIAPAGSAKHAAARDALVAVLIHRLADELSDVRVRSQIHALLSDLSAAAGKRFAD